MRFTIRQVCEFELPGDGDRYFSGQRVAPHSIEGEKIIDALKRDEPRLHRMGRSEYPGQKLPYPLGRRRNAFKVIGAHALAKGIDRIIGSLGERFCRASRRANRWPPLQIFAVLNGQMFVVPLSIQPASVRRIVWRCGGPERQG